MLVFILAQPGAGEQTTPEPVFFFQTPVPGNLFYERENVELEIVFRGEKNSFPFRITSLLIDENNDEVLKRDFAVPDDPQPVIRHKIGPLVPGHYTYLAEADFEGDKKQTRFVKLGVIRKPKGLFSPDQSPFAVDAFLSWRLSSPEKMQKAANVVKRIGIDWVRDRISWNHVQPKKQEWDWSRYDPSQNIQSESDLEILQVFQDSAIWASEKTSGDHSFRSRFAPEDSFAYYEFAKTAANRFSKQVKAWEVWNEFDVPVFFLGTPDDYARILKPAYIGIKRGNPDAAVLHGSVTFASGLLYWGDKAYHDTEGIRFVEKVFENGGGEYFDIFNVHHYGPPQGAVGKIRICRELMHQYGYDKPIWLTEMGSTSTEKMGPTPDTLEHDQACYLVKAYTIALSEGVERFFYFSFPSFVEHGTSFWGILEETASGWQPKPGLVALANLVYSLDGMKYYGTYNTNLPVEAHLFYRESQGCMVLWSRDGKDRQASVFFKNQQENPGIRTLYGKDAIRKPLMVCSLDVGKTPVILHSFDIFDLDQNLLHKPEKPTPPSPEPRINLLKDLWVEIRSQKDHIRFYDLEIKAEVRVYSLSAETKKGELSVILSTPLKNEAPIFSQKVSLDYMQSRTFPFTIPLDKEIKNSLSLSPGREIRVKAVFKQDSGNLASLPAIRYFSLTPPLEISSPMIMNPKTKDALTTVTIKNVSGKRLNMNLKLNVKSHFQCLNPAREISLDTSESRDFMFFLKSLPVSFQERQSIEAEITAEGEKFSCKKTGFLEWGGIPRCFMPFEIDGKPGGWSHFNPFTLQGNENFVHGLDLLDKRGDFRGKVFMAWDKKALYLLAVVQDREVMNPFRNTNPWTGDALELFIDARNEKDLGKPVYDKGVFQIFMVPPDKENPKPLFKVWNPSDTEFTDIQLASMVMKDTYSLEASIPWENLMEEKPQPGRAIGLELTLDDIDEGDYSHRQLIWRGNANNWRDPSLFSRIILVQHLP